jgi:predicted ATPase
MCCNHAGQQPLALCVDDAHWVDEPSLAFLGFLARRLDELPILLVVAVRSMAADAPGTLGALLADSTARVLTLHGLSTDGVQRLLAVETDGPVEHSFALACHEGTAGNPFLLRELIKELEEAGIAPLAANVARVGSLATDGRSSADGSPAD